MSMHRCAGYVEHESAEQLAERWRKLRELSVHIRRELTTEDLLSLLPPRNPTGCPQNKHRAQMISSLRLRGFIFRARGGKYHPLEPF